MTAVSGPRLRIPLTEREREIAVLVAENFSYAEIGDKLALSPHTVRAYVIAAARKIEFDHGRSVEPRLAVYYLIVHQRYIASDNRQ